MIAWNALILLAASAAAPPTVVTAPDQIMQIPPALQQQLQHNVIEPSHSPQQRLQRLVALIFQPEGLGLRYDPTATLTVAETFRERQANCLSFTLLFVALARQAGLNARVQEVGQVVTWHEDQGVIYIAGHVNVGLRVDDREGAVDLDSHVLYDRRGPKPIPDQRALAHFYNNRGAELMAANDEVGAREHFQKALQMDPRFVSTWNNLGVLDARQGDLVAAKGDFDQALSITPGNAPALSNATSLYRRMGDDRHADQLAMRLRRVQRRDPFYHFLRAMDAERTQDYAAAIIHYRAAIRLYRDAHQFHFGLARAYFQLGNNRSAYREMERARVLGDSSPIQARYQAKLDALRRLDAAR